MTSEQLEGAGHDTEPNRLESWKEVASHFGKGVTTVQRWEREEGLPVHRHAHAKKGSIFAFRNELNEWRQSRTEIVESDPGTAPGIESVATGWADAAGTDARVGPTQAVLPRFQRRGQLTMVAAVGMIAALLALVAPASDTAQSMGLSINDQEPLSSSLNGSTMARVPLQNATATFSQSILGGPFSPSQAIDRYFSPSSGWTIAREAADSFGSTQPEVAVFETVTDVTTSSVTFRLYFRHFNPGHLLGRFRFSVTGDNREDFADELHTSGQVDANWVVLRTPIVTGPPGMTFTTLADHSVLVGGAIADEGVYTVTYQQIDSRITGVRLEALRHPSLPGGGGPGLYPASGNFFLTEIEMMVPNEGGRLVP